MSEKGNVVHLFGPPPAVEGAPEVAPRKGYCYPHRPILDEEMRAVSCGKCKAPLDLFDVLLLVSRRYDEWVRLAEETRTMRAEIEALRAEEKRVKARTKSHGRKEAAEAVAAERDKQTRARHEVLTRTNDIRRSLKRIEQLMGKT